MPRLILMFSIVVLVGADEFLLGPILTPIGADLSVSPERVALFITAYSLPLAFMAPILGGLSDRYGRLAVLLPSTLVFGLASIGTATVATFEAGIVTRILTGAASGGMLGIAMAMAGDLGEGGAAKAIAFVTSGLTLGIILSPGIGALSADLLSWRVAFAGIGGLALIVLLASLPLLRAGAYAGQVGTPPESAKTPLFVPGAWGALIAMVFGLGGAVGCFALVGERLRDLFGWGTGTVGLVYVGFGLCTLIGNFAMPMALTRVGSGRALMRIALVFVLAAIATTYAFDRLEPSIILPALIVWAIFGGLGAPALQTYIAQLSPARRGTLMALAESGMNLGIAGASALIAGIYPRGAAWVAVVAAGFILIAIVALHPVGRRDVQASA